MKLFEFIRKMSTQQLAEYAMHLHLDIMTRQRCHREFSSLRRYLGVANLELEARKRCVDMADAPATSIQYAWQSRKDCGVM